MCPDLISKGAHPFALPVLGGLTQVASEHAMLRNHGVTPTPSLQHWEVQRLGARDRAAGGAARQMVSTSGPNPAASAAPPRRILDLSGIVGIRHGTPGKTTPPPTVLTPFISSPGLPLPPAPLSRASSISDHRTAVRQANAWLPLGHQPRPSICDAPASSSRPSKSPRPFSTQFLSASCSGGGACLEGSAPSSSGAQARERPPAPLRPECSRGPRSEDRVCPEGDRKGGKRSSEVIVESNAAGARLLSSAGRVDSSCDRCAASLNGGWGPCTCTTSSGGSRAKGGDLGGSAQLPASLAKESPGLGMACDAPRARGDAKGPKQLLSRWKCSDASCGKRAKKASDGSWKYCKAHMKERGLVAVCK